MRGRASKTLDYTQKIMQIKFASYYVTCLYTALIILCKGGISAENFYNERMKAL